MRHPGLLLLLALGACAAPPPSAYLDGATGAQDVIDLGRSSAGEPCIQNGTANAAEIYCGGDRQPTARVRSAGPATEATLTQLATGGGWRDRINANYVCPAPEPVRAGDPAELVMHCTRRVGGWPYLALVTLSGGQGWQADGVDAALPAMRASIAVLSGRATPRLVSSAAVKAQQAERAGVRAQATGDVRQFDALMRRGTEANLADEPVAAETAFMAALGVQEKVLGPNDPNLANPAMLAALQLSNEGRFGEADALFRRAEQLAARPQNDRSLAPRLLHYEGLDLFNQHKYPAALDRLRAAEAGYLRVIPPETLHASTSRADDYELLLRGAQQDDLRIATSGLVDVRRFEGVVLRELGRVEESEAAIRLAADTARDARIAGPQLTARLLRSAAIGEALAGNSSAAISDYGTSYGAFARAFPSSRPLARNGLLQAGEMVRAGRGEAAIPICRASIKVLLDIKSGFEPRFMSGCLDAYAEAAAAAPDGAARQALLREMFQASQLVRTSTTSQQIQQASARLQAGSGDSRTGQAIRAQQDAEAALGDVRRRREVLLAQAGRDKIPVDARASAALDDEEKAAAANLAERDGVLQEAAPNYNQLIQQATAAADVLATLQPGEAFAAVTMTHDGGYTFLLRDGTLRVGRVAGGSAAIDRLVTRIRAAMTPETPRFDTEAAQALYQAVFGEVQAGLDGATALTVAPMGSLLSVPFGLLLTGPADPDHLAAAPWLMRRMAIGHVPSAGNFVSLGRIGPAPAGGRPWFGFGDFRPVTPAQAQRSFPPASCGDSASLMAHIPPLPNATLELGIARTILNGGKTDTLLGPAFTAAAVERQTLSDVHVLHFATHAIISSDLACEEEPALITSAPANAPDAAGAFLKASDLAQIKLNADLVILSACNSGGGQNGQLDGGESLSTLARSFFFGGARALLITHWDVSDQAAAFLVPDTLRLAAANGRIGYAAALRAAQIEMIDGAGREWPADWIQPFYWAPFALIGRAAPAAETGSVNKS